MSVYFTLTDKKTGVGETLQEVDRRLCEFMKVECNPKFWYSFGNEPNQFQNWENTIGFPLATGVTFAQMRTNMLEMRLAESDEKELVMIDKLIVILAWLDENFTADSGGC